jgi:hypothetical protein
MILNIKVFIPNNMIYGELGRYPVEIDNKLSTISFRANIFVDSNPKYHALWIVCHTIYIRNKIYDPCSVRKDVILLGITLLNSALLWHDTFTRLLKLTPFWLWCAEFTIRCLWEFDHALWIVCHTIYIRNKISILNGQHI